MKNMELYEVGDKVLIEVEVIGVTIKTGGEVMYSLKNPQLGRPFDFMFNADQIKEPVKPKTKKE
jgi:hypothetical protein